MDLSRTKYKPSMLLLKPRYPIRHVVRLAESSKDVSLIEKYCFEFGFPVHPSEVELAESSSRPRYGVTTGKSENSRETSSIPLDD
ncbi:hypothetical protein MGYG_08582 [Nannizzia gypsea CBS 118893]|uniref:Uncharacterized protein n=1 Tax=Arthroderma gypseum (strain ATCC MYA-4604 / CBS 118893) TaxID=535722 RepID=E4V6E3_ARTGP|nr:hypothetical protein MGYG_08582 [Nannizzia gypsea CBS 118893]EFQ96659.1 hypothetical protein MGYG_08582 [Nannizzia gypsea CBS 118893]